MVKAIKSSFICGQFDVPRPRNVIWFDHATILKESNLHTAYSLFTVCGVFFLFLVGSSSPYFLVSNDGVAACFKCMDFFKF